MCACVWPRTHAYADADADACVLCVHVAVMHTPARELCAQQRVLEHQVAFAEVRGLGGHIGKQRRQPHVHVHEAEGACVCVRVYMLGGGGGGGEHSGEKVRVGGPKKNLKPKTMPYVQAHGAEGSYGVW